MLQQQLGPMAWSRSLETSMRLRVGYGEGALHTSSWTKDQESLCYHNSVSPQGTKQEIREICKVPKVTQVVVEQRNSDT